MTDPKTILDSLRLSLSLDPLSPLPTAAAPFCSLLTSAPPPRRRPPNLLRPPIPSASTKPSTPVSRTFARCWPSPSGAPRDGRPPSCCRSPAHAAAPFCSPPATQPHRSPDPPPPRCRPPNSICSPDSPRLHIALEAVVQILRPVLALAVRSG
jgi:hypothetical protein